MTDLPHDVHEEEEPEHTDQDRERPGLERERVLAQARSGGSAQAGHRGERIRRYAGPSGGEEDRSAGSPVAVAELERQTAQLILACRHLGESESFQNEAAAFE